MIGVSQISVSAYRGGGGAAPVNLDFVSTWDTTLAGSASDTIVLPLLSGGTYSGTIDWGDGNSDALSYANRTHVYASSGTYTITISGSDIQGFQFNNGGDKAKITDISNWGNLTLTGNAWFHGCSNLDISANDAPTFNTSTAYRAFDGCSNLSTPNFSSWDMSGFTDTSAMFRVCVNFNADISMWDMSNVTVLGGYASGLNFGMFSNASIFNQPVGLWNITATDIRCIFSSATQFNQDISSWNISGCNNLFRCFSGATSFNQPLNNWDVSNVTQMFQSFNAATSFNQDLSMWDVSSVTNMKSAFVLSNPVNITGWDVSSVTDFSYMLSYTSFNENISVWDVSSGVNFGAMFNQNQVFNQPIGVWNMSSALFIGGNNAGMFDRAYAFDQDISSWDINQTTDFRQFMRFKTGINKYSTANYDALLVGWEAQSPLSNKTIDFGGAQYTIGSAAETARTSLITTYGWTITDGGGI